MLFDAKNFNGEVFGAYVDKAPNLNRNELLKSGAIVEKSQYAAMLPDQTGGNYITVPIKARIGGTASNYDGNTDIGTTSRKTYTHGRVVVGRSNGWTEKDFSSDITGEDFLPATEEVAEYWDDVDQATLLKVLEGIFAMTGAKNLEFVNGHTYDISGNETVNTFDETTLNNAIQQALGDNKGKFKMAIMHSQVATNLENLKLVSYLKYTDKDGVERDLTLGSINGRLVLIDDTMPTETVPAVEEVKDSEGKVTTAAQPAYVKYTTYVLGEGAIEYTNCGAKKPYSMSEDDKTNGGETTLWSRQRKIFSPYGISFKQPSFISPTDEQLATGSNWELANSNESGTKEYFPHKAIPIARIITRG
ncbi:MAG: major capsid protein [Lachnospiraceae bacterium]|nr:major capsid protein [Lachnospiraceae bacterium]